MRVPSIKTLSRIHDADHAAMRRILKMTRQELISLPCAALQDYRKSCYGSPMTYIMRMTALNEAARCHGIESHQATNGEFVTFLNTGDSYADTIIYWRGTYRVQSIGDFIERMERQNVIFN